MAGEISLREGDGYTWQHFALAAATAWGIAQAARLYWKGVSLVIPFQGRRYPNAPDLANRLLNYGYAVLARAWLRIVLLAGLEPHLGMLHADRQGRPSLVLDLMEPWRPWVDPAADGGDPASAAGQPARRVRPTTFSQLWSCRMRWRMIVSSRRISSRTTAWETRTRSLPLVSIFTGWL